MVEAKQPQPVHLSDYRPPAWRVEQVELCFALDPEQTRVTSRLSLARTTAEPEPLVLDGRELELESVAVDGRRLEPGAYEVDERHLTLCEVPERFVLETVSVIDPRANTSLMGLYVSNGVFCTQCEAEGFRRITWFLDRPDVMARYRVRIEADKAACPLLLSNGNPVEQGDLGGGRHFAVWDDPFPKPAYLFALVAGDLATLEDRFTTRSGREVTLRIHADEGHIGQCRHALESLKKSMRWDEDVYGLEYDLDLFQIVAVSDFNFGAMENKGLNIFNTSAALADPETATDADFMQVERIIAHEYFHNWTGNRVTCRDWFQLTLKEGLTVFRDQQFAADMHSPALKRIGDVVLLRDAQFAEDAGPLAHPIRPDSYVEINNFYTRTVYEKGAEIIRMIHTLLGPEQFRRGIDLYFRRHDGQAVTCEDFLAAMADASGRDLAHFARWYSQAGTPALEVRRSYDAGSGRLTLEFRQSTPPTRGQPEKLPLHIPVSMGLVGKSGRALELQLEGENEPRGTSRVLELKEPVERFTFVGVEEEAVPSLLRGFSAPVRLDAGYSREDLALLLAHDEDAFSRWEAGQTLAVRLMLQEIAAIGAGREPSLDDALPEAFRVLLGDREAEPAFLARAVSLPGRSYLAQQLDTIPVEALQRTLRFFQAGLGRRLADLWQGIFEAHAGLDPASIETSVMGRRALRNISLAYLVWGDVPGSEALALEQYRQAGNMTDRLAALRALAEGGGAAAEAALADFYEKWKHEDLVVNKWLALQASMEDARALERVRALTAHPAFSLANPNRVRALVGVFANMNLTGFHRADGAGYEFLADRVLELDRLNSQVAARLLTAFGRWRRFDAARQSAMRGQLERVLAVPGLSRDCYEIASKSVA
ncbi:aminopeptidase N [Geminicoccaceae bacterium 1502E]|nr:aminopeptidase N [Geminicoccaceae bacterium 1502E]